MIQACGSSSQDGLEKGAPILHVAKINGQFYFRAGERVFSKDPEGDINSGAKKWDPSSKQWSKGSWRPLIDFGPENKNSARLFSFRSFQKSDRVLLIIQTRPELLKGTIAPFPSYVLFRYSDLSEDPKLSHLLTFTRPLKGGHYVAKIDRFSSNEKYVSLNLYTCWSCVGVHPKKFLLDLESLVVRDIGKVSYFKWGLGSQYEYKDYVEKPCFEAESAAQYLCPEDPSNLPLKRASFESAG